MDSKIKTLLLLIFLVLTFIVIYVWFGHRNVYSQDFEIIDSNDNLIFEVGEKLKFTPSDTAYFNEHKATWYFGNRDSITQTSPSYQYKQKGKYLITLKIDDKFEIPRYIEILERKVNTALDSVPHITGPTEGFVKEQLVFNCDTPGISSWYWEFGETGNVDAYEDQVIYSYQEPGNYTINLKTNQSKYAIQHQIVIKELFDIVSTGGVDQLQIAAQDIKQKLQEIANASINNQNIFYKNTKYIKDTYQCNTPIVIIVNGRYNDLHSYCQGLHFLETSGNSHLQIHEVKITKHECLEKIEINQSIIR